MNDDFGDRMKLYERRETDRRTMPLLPVCVRLDGKGFSRYTQDLIKPYDDRFVDLMAETTRRLVKDAGARIGYTQSDEISLVLYSDSMASQIYFDGKIQKLVSVLASMGTAHFNSLAAKTFPHKAPAVLDCRVWSVPNQVEAVNNLIWREQDAVKNSISAAARQFYGAKELYGRSCPEMQEMLFQKGINWNDYPDHFKRGVYFQKHGVQRALTDDERGKIPEALRPLLGEIVERTETRRLEMPPLAKVVNRIAVIFDGADPICEKESKP